MRCTGLFVAFLVSCGGGDYAQEEHEHDPHPPSDHDGDFAASDHNHDEDYSPAEHDHDGDYSPLDHDHDADYVNIAGDTMSGALTVEDDIFGERFVLSSPRTVTKSFSAVGFATGHDNDDDFVRRNLAGYLYMADGVSLYNAVLYATVHVPDGSGPHRAPLLRI